MCVYEIRWCDSPMVSLYWVVMERQLQQFNVPGIFQGELYKVIETRTSTNSNGLLLLGDFSRFDGNMVRNAMMIEVDYE